MLLAGVVLGAYLLGAMPFGLWIGKGLYNIDLRDHGSKNTGATNAYRVLGRWPALLVFACDTAKGMAGVYLGSVLVGGSLAEVLGGIAAISGHNWSVFMGFKGGRGVATGLGVIALLAPMVTAIVFGVWCIVVFLTRYVSLGSIVAAALVPPLMWCFDAGRETFWFGVAAAAFVILRHRPNIERLLRGQELKIKAAAKKP
ncbi:MAG: glycerol-3-phosphate 1-O-acyltransferase PlsY [Negativicutes bacterium]